MTKYKENRSEPKSHGLGHLSTQMVGGESGQGDSRCQPVKPCPRLDQPELAYHLWMNATGYP